MRRLAAAAAGLAALLVLAPAPARSGAAITTPFGAARRDTLGPGGLPLPAVAAQRSAEATMVPVAVGAGAILADLTAARSGYLVVGGYFAISGGLVLGPAAGYFYGRLPRRARLGVLARLVVVAGPPVAAAWAGRDRGGDVDWEPTLKAMVGGLAAGAALAALDVALVEGEVRRHNEAVAAPAVSLVPAAAPFSRAPGVAVRVAFPAGGD